MSSSIRTRSRTAKGKLEADVVYQTDLTNAKKEKIRVISKKKVRADVQTFDRLKKKFDDIAPKPDEDVSRFSMATVVAVTHVNTFLYAACFFIQVGTLPYLSKKLGADPTTFGQLQTAFAIAQLAGGPVYGRLGDLMGQKLALIVAFASATTSYTLMGFSYDLNILFVSRLPSVFMHVMQGSQMVITSLSDEDGRAVALSRLGFSYGIGMVVGPTLGGLVTKYFGEQYAALVAASGSILSLLLVQIFVPDLVTPRDKVSEDKKRWQSVFNIHAIAKLFLVPGAAFILVIKLILGVPIGVLQSMFSVIAMEKFGMAAEHNGMLLSYIGLISLLMQGFGISFVARFFSDKTVMLSSAIGLTVIYYFLTLLTDIWQFVAVLMPLTIGLCLVNSILTASVTKTVPNDQTGTILGLNMAVHSTIRSLSPTVGGYCIQTFGFQSIGFIGVVCNTVVVAILCMTEMTCW